MKRGIIIPFLVFPDVKDMVFVILRNPSRRTKSYLLSQSVVMEGAVVDCLEEFMRHTDIEEFSVFMLDGTHII